PTRGLDDLDVQALLLIEAHGLRHDDRRCAGDRNKADLEIFFLDRAGSGENFGRGLQWKELRQRGERGRCTERLQESAAALVGREHGAHDPRGTDVLIAFVLTLDSRALQFSCGVAFVARLTGMVTAGAAAAIQRTRGVEWVIEGGHGYALRWTGLGLGN